MPPPEPEVIDLTETPRSPEFIVIDSSDDDAASPVKPTSVLPQKGRHETPRKWKKSESPKQPEHEISAKYSSRDHSMRGDVARARDNSSKSAVYGKRALQPDELHDLQRDKRRREEGRSREGNASGRRRSRSQERRHRGADPSPRNIGSGIFFVDVAPAQITASPEPLVSDSDNTSRPFVADQDEPVKLLLPAHVSVLDSGANAENLPVRILPSSEADLAEDYIEYLEYDDLKVAGAVRYFDQEATETKRPRFVCKNCGAAGEHKTAECPTQVCLTCGARDEHSTRGCPIGKTCYNCGMKGHISRTCPNRYSLSSKDHRAIHDCDRCGSVFHQTNECPTLWRLYDYHTADEQESVLRVRESKRKLGFGHGGEGYIAMDEWCYNCGKQGHWGDDCNEIPRAHHAPNEPSAFGLHNSMSGPFFDTSSRYVSSPIYKREVRDWEREDIVVDSWGHHAPAHVGQQGRKKERARMERRVKEQEMDDDDDWFGRSHKARSIKRSDSQERRSGPSGKDRSPEKRMSFGTFHQSPRRSFDVPTKPRSLRDRLNGEFDRPPPTHPRGRRRSDSLLERLGNQVGYPRPGEGHQEDRPVYPNDRQAGLASYKPWSKGSVASLEERPHEREWKRKPTEGYEKPGPRYKGAYTR